MKILFFFSLSVSVFATVNEPLRWEIFSGYRNDRIHWHLQNSDGGALTYSELYRDVQYFENGLVLKVIHRDLTFFLRGAYGAFGKGKVFQRYAGLSSQPHFHFSTHGWAADASGYFGYAINLTKDRTYKVILTPLIGYSGYFEQLKRNSRRPAAIGPFSSSLPGAFRLVWNGFFFGGAFTIEPGGMALFHVGYSYHLMHNRVHTTVQNSSSEVPTRQSIKTSSGGNKGQTGWAQMDWILRHDWRLGIGGQIHYFSTRVVDAVIQETGRGDFFEKFKLRWTVFSGWAQISRTF